MIITEPKKLSLPQQVEKNRLDIEALLAAAILLGSIIEIEDLSHILTTEELALANRPVSFIAYNNEVYAKSWTDDSYIYFLTEVKFNLGTPTTFLYKQIKASINSGQLEQETKSFSTYPAAALDLALAQKANLSGAAFTGGITAPSIIEDMVGYSYGATTASSGFTKTFIGAVKNGNKLTLVWAGRFTFASGEGSVYLGRIYIPKEIGNKIYGINEGGNIIVYNKASLNRYDNVGSQVSVDYYVEKNSYNVNLDYLIPRVYTSGLDSSRTYVVRIELTLLLNESL